MKKGLRFLEDLPFPESFFLHSLKINFDAGKKKNPEIVINLNYCCFKQGLFEKSQQAINGVLCKTRSFLFFFFCHTKKRFASCYSCEAFRLDAVSSHLQLGL